MDYRARFKKFLKIISSLTLVFFSVEQIVLADPALLTSPLPELPVTQSSPNNSQTQTNPSSFEPDSQANTNSFLSGNSTMSEAGEDSPESAPFQEVGTLGPERSLSLSKMKALSGTPVGRVSEGSAPLTTFKKTDEDEIAIQYNLTGQAGARAGITLLYQGLGYPPVSSFDLSKEPIEVGMKAPASRVLLEIHDIQGRVSRVWLETQGRNTAYYRIQHSSLTGEADLSQVSHLQFWLYGQDLARGKEIGDFTVFAKGLYASKIKPWDPRLEGYVQKPLENASSLTHPTTRHVRIVSSTAESFELEFSNLKTRGGEVSIELGDYDFSTKPYLGFSLQGDTSKLRLTLEDANGKTNILYLEGIESSNINDYVIDLSRLTSNGMAPAHLKRIKIYAFPNASYTAPGPGKLSAAFGVWETSGIEAVSSLITNQANYAFSYSFEGQIKTQSFQLADGINRVEITEGAVRRGFQIELDREPPVISVTSSALSPEAQYELKYAIDGVLKTKFVSLNPGNNEIRITETDLAGNETELIWNVFYDLIPQIQPAPQPFRTSEASQLPQTPWAGVVEEPAVLNNQSSAIQFLALNSNWMETRYDLRNTQNRVGVEYRFDGLGVPPSVSADLSALDSLKAGLRTEASRVLVTVEDVHGTSARAYLMNAGGNVARLYEIPKNDFFFSQFSSFDWTQVTKISFSMDKGDAGGREEGIFKINLKGLQSQSAQKITNNEGYSFRSLRDGEAIVTDSRSSRIVENRAGKLVMEFDGLRSGAVEGPVLDISGIDFTKEPVLGIWAQGSVKDLRLEIADGRGVKRVSSLYSISKSGETLYGIDLSRIAGLDLNSIQSVSLRAEKNSSLQAGETATLSLRYGFVKPESALPPIQVTSPALAHQADYILEYEFQGVRKTSSYTLNLGLNEIQINEVTSDGYPVKKNWIVQYELDYPTVPKNPALSSADITRLPSEPAVQILNGSLAGTHFSSLSSTGISVQYDFLGSMGDAQAGVTLNYEGLGLGPSPSADLSSLDTLIFGIRTEAGRVRMEVEDGDLTREGVYLNYDDPSFREKQIFEVSKSLFSSEIDWTRIKNISFIVDKTGSGESEGYLRVYANGLFDFERKPMNAENFREKDMREFSLSDGTLPTISAGSDPNAQITYLDSGKVEIDYADLRSKKVRGPVFSFSPSHNWQSNPILAFSLEGDVTALDVTVKDAAGQEVELKIKGIPSRVKGYYEIDLSRVSGLIDSTQVTEIQFVAQKNTRLPAGAAAHLVMEYGLWVEDVTGPSIEILTTQTLTKQRNFTIAYRADGQEGAQQFQLEEGENQLTLRVSDRASNVTEVPYRVTLDTIAPLVTVTSVTVTNNADYTLEYTVDGVAKQQAVTLVEGENALVITETDEAGNSSTQNFTVTLDTIAPLVTVTSASLTNNADYTLEYTVDGIAKQRAVTLVEGENALVITETDEA
ncbi:MAG: hypothetical protein HY586_04670, partial [Candidatus Omnitrophica bacterium]|nr:hypothetical protein [Candidatus Omnitrophota bacterium]